MTEECFNRSAANKEMKFNLESKDSKLRDLRRTTSNDCCEPQFGCVENIPKEVSQIKIFQITI